MQETSLPRPSDRWIPWYFVAFFVVLTSILVPMCVIAVRTNTGLVTDGAYEKGLAYNKAIQAFDEQKKLNWQGDVLISPTADGAVRVDFSLKDSAGHPLDGADAHFWLVRPTQAGHDQTFVMRAVGNGHYQVEVTTPVHGLWEARAAANLNGHNFQTAKRIVLP